MSDVSPAQRRLLDFFGLSASTKADAHAALNRAMADPVQQRRWVVERARRCVAAMAPAVAGSGGHDATFSVACALVHGFALSVGEAGPLMAEYNARCSPPWSERELDYKLRSAERASHDKPRGHLLGDMPSGGGGSQGARSATASEPNPPPPPAPKKVNFDPVLLRQKAGQWRGVVKQAWLANRSAVDPATVSAAEFLRLLYGADPAAKVLCFTNQRSQGQALWPAEAVPESGPEGVWFLPQPVDGESHINPRMPPGREGGARWSRRSEESVVAWRYMVLESDEADAADWLGLLVQLPLRIEAIYTSGGRSVHGLVRVDCRTKLEWDNLKVQLAPTLNLLCLGGLDPKVITAVRLTRLPGCWRNGRMQKLLYVQPGAPVRRLIDAPVVRYVEAFWEARAREAAAERHVAGCDAAEAALEFYRRSSDRARIAYNVLQEARVAGNF